MMDPVNEEGEQMEDGLEPEHNGLVPAGMN